ncbi:MAG: hypothetical protein V2A58_04210 [Planctomycetota bacterium]
MTLLLETPVPQAAWSRATEASVRPSHAGAPTERRVRAHVPVCKLCKLPVRSGAQRLFLNGQTHARTDLQCVVCTAWELAPASSPGNIRTDIRRHG